MNNSLLGSIDKKSVNEFRKDLLQMLRIGQEMDRYYAESNQDFGNYIKKFKSLVESFNKKYKGLNLKIAKKPNEVELKMLINEKNVKECFASSASKITGLQSIGVSSFGAVVVSDAESFANELEKAKDRLYIAYYNPQTGKSNLFLQYNKKEKKVELVYDKEEIENEPSAEFQLAAYYALIKGCNKKINLHDEGATLGFSSLLSHIEKMKYFEKFDPHMAK
ncbi:hypothetical protein KY347_00110 [Candidatus Woesearchaeota archaeon]|nr:hypothetical protein [Candidatus Woesearchaeota archaeon]